MSSPVASHGYERVATAVVIGCLAALCAWQVWAYRRVEIYHPDSSTYVVLAENLARGGGYVFDGRPHTRFPPGLPMLLAAWSSAGDGRNAAGGSDPFSATYAACSLAPRKRAAPTRKCAEPQAGSMTRSRSISAALFPSVSGPRAWRTRSSTIGVGV